MRPAAALSGYDGDVLVLSGDTPLLTPELLAALVETHRSERAAATILSAVPADPRLYGRIVRDDDGAVLRIVEGTDATPEELELGEINSSIYVFRSDALWPALERLQPKNVQGELYLTDAIEILVEAGERVAAHVAPDANETDGVNTRVELAHAAAVLRDRINEQHMLAGVTIVDPATTWIEPTVELEEDVTINPFTVLRGRTVVRRGAEIGPHTVAVDAEIGARAIVGPFCYLRPGTVSASPRRRAPSWRSRTRASATARRCRTCRTSATPRSARTRTSGPARSRRTSATAPASRSSARRSAATSEPRSTMGSSHPSRWVTEHGLPPAR